MHKFTEVASGEREKQISCHSPHFFVGMTEVMKWWKVTYRLGISECRSSK